MLRAKKALGWRRGCRKEREARLETSPARWLPFALVDGTQKSRPASVAHWAALYPWREVTPSTFKIAKLHDRALAVIDADHNDRENGPVNRQFDEASRRIGKRVWKSRFCRWRGG